MDLESAKLAVDSAKDTQLITLNKLLSPPELGTGSRSGSDSESDAEAHLEPYAVEQDAAKPADGTSGGSSSRKQHPGAEGLASKAQKLLAAAARPRSAAALKRASQPVAGGPASPEARNAAPQASAAGTRSAGAQKTASQASAARPSSALPAAHDVRAAEAVVRSTMLPVQVPFPSCLS